MSDKNRYTHLIKRAVIQVITVLLRLLKFVFVYCFLNLFIVYLQQIYNSNLIGDNIQLIITCEFEEILSEL